MTMEADEAERRFVGRVRSALVMANYKEHAPSLAEAVVQSILSDTDALTALLDPAEIGARWTPDQWQTAFEGGERAGMVERMWGDELIWKIVVSSSEGSES